MNIVIPMAGFGQRFVDAGYTTIKPLIEIDGKPMVVRAVQSLGLDGQFIFILRKFEGSDRLEEILHKNFYKPIIRQTAPTEGPACTVLTVQELINGHVPLVIANCDQIMEWDKIAFYDFCKYTTFKGFVVTFEGGDVRNSFVKLDEFGKCSKFTEKEKVSDIALAGIHFWKRGRDFIESANRMIKADDRAPNGEFYVSKTYNYMLNWAPYDVGIYHIPLQCFNAVGTPEELDRYLSKKNAKV